MTTALDIVKGALRNINSYQSGETIAPQDEQDCLDKLNDLLDSWSTDEMFVYGSNENILQWVPGKNQYTIGNPTNQTLGYANIIGTVSGSTITTSSIPSQLVAGTSTLNASTLTDLAGVFPAGTYVSAIGSGTITMSQAATSNPSGNDTIYWTVPGDFGIPRPLNITGGFTRINALDFWLDVKATQAEYISILYKAQPGPWPTVCWYNMQDPYGILNVYQTPGQGATLHLFTSTILANLTANQTIVLPQGYVRALKWCLAREIAPEYGYNFTNEQKKLAAESLAMVKALNAKPQDKARYDSALLRGRRGADGGFILHGGYQ